MDPLYEQRLRDEVIYLHSLWHQGPPRPSSSASTSTPTRRHHLQPTKSTHFKKDNKNNNRTRNAKKPTNNPNDTVPQPSSGPQWPCPAPPPHSPPTWSSFEPKPLSLPPEEQSMLAARNAHQHALKAVRKFFSDGDGFDQMDTSDDEDDELTEDECGREVYSFFFKVFKEDNELREYCLRNYAKGEFTCLLCGALRGKKTGRKFRSCLALVQHAITVVKKRRAHRAYAQAVCKVLGWDIDQLPSIASSLSDISGAENGNGGSDNKESLGTLGSNAGSVEGRIVEGNNDEVLPESGHNVTETLHNGDEGDMNSLTFRDVGEKLEDPKMAHPHNVEGPAAEGTTIRVNEESPITFVNDANSVEGKNDEAVRESGINVAGVLPNCDEGDMNSLTFPDAGEKLEDSDLVHPHNVEEPAAEGSNIVNIGTVYPDKVVKTASEELPTNSSICPNTDENLENLGMVHPSNVAEPETQILGGNTKQKVPLDENDCFGNEMQDLQMGNGENNSVGNETKDLQMGNEENQQHLQINSIREENEGVGNEKQDVQMSNDENQHQVEMSSIKDENKGVGNETRDLQMSNDDNQHHLQMSSNNNNENNGVGNERQDMMVDNVRTLLNEDGDGL